MFGLEGDKKKSGKEFVFDLESEIKDVNKYKELVDTVEKRTRRIKNMLRKGIKKEEYGQLGILLAGYVALLKVVGRIGTK